MIEVNVDRSSTGEILTFSMSGHADSGPYGYDLVCAGASAVSFGAVNAIASICNVELNVDMKDEGGYLLCAVPEEMNRAVREQVQLLLEGMLVSLATIAEEYGEYITIDESRR
ncbi:ribosomal-processing cysteine protease Prp [Alteribacillus sp. HJP-4]|uniref:ribosomal-processing cysteine protease Prp n=1 Tax=Alteribacillus sp. HJP-4 TaxID=2775394 RepID=UPI0035CCF9B9